MSRAPVWSVLMSVTAVPGWYSTPSSSASVSVSSSMVRCDKLIPQAAGFHGPGIRDGAYEDMTKTGRP